MRFSKHNILGRIKDSGSYFIVNCLSGNADILTAEKYEEILSGKLTDLEEYETKGYLMDEKEEERLYRKAYVDFLDARERDEVQLFFVPTYDCNFACAYCYQSAYGNKRSEWSTEVADAFFAYIEDAFYGRKSYITLFGGEPLLPGEINKKYIEYFLFEAEKRRQRVAIVTNGYTLSEFSGILDPKTVKEIQVTLDGTNDTHNARRFLKGGGPTFDKIVQGIDDMLEKGIPVNLRVVLDKSNIDGLPELARFAIRKKWTENSHFKTQLGRNYELHFCQKNPDALYGRLELYKDVYLLVLKHPEILEFHRPAYSVSKFLFDNGRLPDPLFDSCPGCKTEWAFDYTGAIYSCTATVGKTEERLGTFFPAVELKEDAVREWQNRDVLSIRECKDCRLALACGGGCAAVAKNKTGALNSPDCRPVQELLEMGISLYYGKGEYV